MICRRKLVSLIEDKGIYNPLVKKQVRKDTFGEDSHEFYDPGKPGLEKFIFFFKTWFYGFSYSNCMVRT